MKTEKEIRALVEGCLRPALPPGAGMPADDQDWIESGLLDSMGHVEVLTSLERATGAPDLFERPGVEPPTTVRAAIEAIRKGFARSASGPPAELRVLLRQDRGAVSATMAVAGWGEAVGEKRVPIAQVEREFGLPAGKLSQGAGLESVCRVRDGQDEVSLARAAAQQALAGAEAGEEELDWILATSETRVGVPSLGAALHSALLAPPACAVLDVGGSCGGVANCLMAADALFAAGRARCILLVSADVHSRLLVPGRVPGEFGGLFGDGGSALLLRRAADVSGFDPYTVRHSMAGCAGAYASAIQVWPEAQGDMGVHFDGEALARAAVDRMAGVLDDLEAASRLSRTQASAFVIHQPNPRLVEILAKRGALPLEKIPQVARTAGNLGAATAGVSLSRALQEHGRKPPHLRGPIFLVTLGPGLLWQGMILE